MAARKRKTELTDAWKAKIQASILALRLYEHAQGKIPMANSQIKAAQILLGKMIPDLARTELSGPGPNGEHVFSRIVREVVDPK